MTPAKALRRVFGPLANLHREGLGLSLANGVELGFALVADMRGINAAVLRRHAGQCD